MSTETVNTANIDLRCEIYTLRDILIAKEKELTRLCMQCRHVYGPVYKVDYGCNKSWHRKCNICEHVIIVRSKKT